MCVRIGAHVGQSMIVVVTDTPGTFTGEKTMLVDISYSKAQFMYI